MTKTYFYYLRDKERKPLVTVCLHCDDKGEYYRGVAVCSPKDSPNKRVGRNIALGRVLQAIKHGERKNGMVGRKEVFKIYDKVECFFIFKSRFFNCGLCYFDFGRYSACDFRTRRGCSSVDCPNHNLRHLARYRPQHLADAFELFLIEFYFNEIRFG